MEFIKKMTYYPSYSDVQAYRKMRKALARDNTVHLLVPSCPDGRPLLACSRSPSDIDEHNLYLAPLFLSFSGSQCKECLDYFYASQVSKDRDSAIAINLK